MDARTPNPDFVLNRPQQAGTSVLLAGKNFGCGSSREHAVWALAEWGIKAIVAPSFGAIFFDNCVRNGLLPVVLGAADLQALATAVAADPQACQLTLDLPAMQLRGPGDGVYPITLIEEQRQMLLSGQDPVTQTLQLLPDIEAFEMIDRQRNPWLYLA